MTENEKSDMICKSVFKDGSCQTSQTALTNIWISLIRQMEQSMQDEYS